MSVFLIFFTALSSYIVPSLNIELLPSCPLKRRSDANSVLIPVPVCRVRRGQVPML